MGVQFVETDITKYAKVLYDFKPEEDVELSLKVSDLVKIYKFSGDGKWCYGEINGSKGWFPYNHVINIEEEEYNELLKEKTKCDNGDISENAIKEENINEENKKSNNELAENDDINDEAKNKLKALERQIKCSTIGGGLYRASSDGKRSWYNAYQGSVRYKPKNASLLAMKENSPSSEKNSSDKVGSRHSSITVEIHRNESGKAKSDSNLLGDSHLFRRLDRKSDSRKSDTIEFVNGPAKLKMKWVDFIGGQSVVDSMGLTKKSIKRQEVIYEMIDTERDYVNDLSIIINLYMLPMIKNNLLPKREIKTLFSNIEQLYGVNQELLKLFEKRQEENPYIQEIGDIWLTMLEFLKMYMLYCGNYAYAITQLEDLKSSKSVTKFLNTQFQKKESRSLKLESFLIKPVQRICKYPLLLRELIKFTNEYDKDYENLVKAYDKLEIVVTVVNGASKEAEAVHNLIAFQSRFNPKISIVSTNRRIIYKCEVNVYMKKLTSQNQDISALLNSSHNLEKKKRLLFIFDDLILFAKSLSQESDKLDKGKLKLIQKREYSNVEIKQTNLNDNSMKNAIVIMLNNPEILTVIFCDTEESKKLILDHLNTYIKEYQEINIPESGPRIIKSLPSEKVYSMISNKNQETNEEEDGEMTPTPEKLEDMKAKEKIKAEVPEIKEKELKNTENTEITKYNNIKLKEELESSPIVDDDDNSEIDKLSPLRISDVSTTLTNSNILSCSSLDSYADGNTQDESNETDFNEEGQNQNEFKEVMKMLDTFISNSNESLYNDPNNYSNEYSHGKESSVIIKEDEEDSPPILSFKNEPNTRLTTNSFPSIVERFNNKSNTNENIHNSVTINKNITTVNNTEKSNENDKLKTEIDHQSRKRRSILNRISFYEKISTDTKDDNDDFDGCKSCQVDLSNNYPIRNAYVNDVLCKMKNAKKYYVYEINVNLNSCASSLIPTLKDNTESSINIYHTFDEFFDFHFQFIEATISNKDNKIYIPINQIPTLPSQVQCVNDRIARKRISGLQIYINGVLNLLTVIASPDIVYNFFSASGYDSMKLMEE